MEESRTGCPAFLSKYIVIGDECTDVTGGWTLRQGPNDSTAGYNKTATLTKNADSISITSPAASCGQANVNNRVDLSNYSSLNIYALAAQNNAPHHISIRNTNNSSDKNFVADLNFSGNGLHTLDISELIGDYYIIVYLSSSASSPTKTLTFNEVYLS